LCDPAQLKFSGNLASGEGEVYEFTYKGTHACNIVISPQWKPSGKTSLWVYKPDKTAVVADSSNVSKNTGSILTSGNKGTYRLSVHNKDSSSIDFQLLVSLAKK